MSALTTPVVPPESPLVRPWDGWRPLLALAWLLLLATTALVGERSASLGDLQRDLATGTADDVRVVGGLPPAATGYAEAEVHWRDGSRRFQTQVFEVRGPSAARELRQDDGDVGAVVRTGLAERVAADHPGVSVRREPRGVTEPGHFLGWLVPQWVGWLTVALVVAGLALVRRGPDPWRANRWAWAWLLLTPVGTVLFLLTSGPTPFVPAPRNPARRLTGGWSLLLVILVGGALGSWF